MNLEKTGAVFHYSRDDRLEMRYDHQEMPSWYKRSRGTLILVVDFLIIIIFFGVYQLVLKPDNSTAEFSSYRFELRAVEFDGEVLASLKTTALEDLLPESSIINFQFSTTENFSQAEDIQDLLPVSMEYNITTRLRLPLASRIYVRGDILNENSDEVWDFMVFVDVESE